MICVLYASIRFAELQPLNWPVVCSVSLNSPFSVVAWREDRPGTGDECS
jgi:hypothetical protein